MQSTVDTPALNTGKRLFFRRNQLCTPLAFLSLSSVGKFQIHTLVFWINRPILPNLQRSLHFRFNNYRFKVTDAVLLCLTPSWIFPHQVSSP